MGVNTRTVRIVIVATATLITAACVAISGIIGWVGLVIPHFARMLVGYDYRTMRRAVFPLSHSGQGEPYMMLEVDGLHYAYRKTYKKHDVLRGVNFSADIGQCICVVGKNGAGKTTLFRCLLGLMNDYQGNIFVDGLNGKHLSVQETAKKIAYIPQAHAPAFNYSVFETVLMGTNALMGKFRTPGRAERETAEQMLEQMNIEHLAERGYAELSGGERQLVLIARALAQKSRMLIMDEPTANLDYGNQFRVMRQVRQLTKRGYLVVLSTHNPEHALLYADKVLVLKEGRTAMYGEPKSVLNPGMIESIYGVSVDLQTIHAPWGSVPVFVPCFE
jgi:iron complex transport system ATP-binding protein